MTKKRALQTAFDSAFYLRTNPDVAAAGMDPLDHYVKYGAAEQRQPHPLFDPAHYLDCCPEAHIENPLLHFLRMNRGRWAATHPLFDCESYLRAHPEAGNPLLHHQSHRTAVGLEGSQFGQC